MSREIRSGISRVRQTRIRRITTLLYLSLIGILAWTSRCGEESSTAPCDWATLRITVTEWDGNPITTWIHVENDSRTLRAKDTTSDRGILELQLRKARAARNWAITFMNGVIEHLCLPGIEPLPIPSEEPQQQQGSRMRREITQPRNPHGSRGHFPTGRS